MNEEQFKKAISLLANFKVRSEITLEEIPAPQRLAKFSYALSADVSNGLLGDNEAELANGRFVVLHEPGGQDSWEGEFRCVTFLNADLDNDEADDPTLPEHGWKWLLKALDENGCKYTAPSGTVTRAISKSFGKLSTDTDGGEIEIRASWTALITKPEELTEHLQAWCNLLAEISYLQPIPEGVASFRR
jgi:Protein of unknown function (DUF3000)